MKEKIWHSQKESVQTVLSPFYRLMQGGIASFPLTMTTDMPAYATKKDLANLKKALQKSCASKKDIAKLSLTTGGLKQGLARTDKRLDSFHSEFVDWKDESIMRFNRIDERLYGLEIRMDEWRDELRSDMQTMTQDIKFYFEAAVENFRKDMRDVKNDGLENVKHRVTRLEIHTGIRAA